MTRVTKLLIVIALAVIASAAQTLSPGGLDMVDGSATAATYKGKTAVRITNAKANDAIGIVKGSKFSNGTLELNVAGAPGPGASTTARGFIGLAFRIQGHGDKYEYFYLRPTNGRADDQVRRNHSAQYASHPDYPWQRLRKEEPEKYESYVDLEPAVWTAMKIVVSGQSAKLYVNGAAQPCLIVNDMKLGDSSGAIALWTGPGTDGYFADLKVSEAR